MGRLTPQEGNRVPSRNLSFQLTCATPPPSLLPSPGPRPSSALLSLCRADVEWRGHSASGTDELSRPSHWVAQTGVTAESPRPERRPHSVSEERVEGVIEKTAVEEQCSQETPVITQVCAHRAEGLGCPALLVFNVRNG